MPSSPLTTSESVVCKDIQTVVNPATTEEAGRAMMNHGQNCRYQGFVSSRFKTFLSGRRAEEAAVFSNRNGLVVERLDSELDVHDAIGIIAMGAHAHGQ